MSTKRVSLQEAKKILAQESDVALNAPETRGANAYGKLMLRVRENLIIAEGPERSLDNVRTPSHDLER